MKAVAVDCVIIGINSAASLQACIEHIKASHYEGSIQIYYVDSGSTDRSIEIAKSCGATVIELKPSHPTPGLGRNAGWRAGHAPFVQFVDSDTLLNPLWLKNALPYFTEGVGALRGQLDELHPNASVFNWIGQQEWNPLREGEVDCLGGNALVRREVLEETNGFDEELVVGEDPELSQRILAKQWKIIHLHKPMAQHDLAMFKISHYLKRSFRTGYGFAVISGRYPKSFWYKELCRILYRGGLATLLVLLALIGSFWTPFSLLLLVASCALVFYPRLFSVTHLMSNKQLSRAEACRYAWHCSVVVLPQFAGVLRYFLGRLLNRPLRNRGHRLRTGVSHRMRCFPLFFALLSLSACDLAHNVRPFTPVKSQPTSNAEFESIRQEEMMEAYEAGKDPAQAMERSLSRFDNKATRKPPMSLASNQALEELAQKANTPYLIDGGDVLAIQVWHRPELSAESVIVGPDGVINIPRVGNVMVSGKTREEALEAIRSEMAKLFDDPDVTMTIKQYNNNKVYVLGRVNSPGVIHFPGRANLLEAITRAGGIPDYTTDPSGGYQLRSHYAKKNVAILRGNKQIIWINISELLCEGNLTLNAPLVPNDIIFVPEPEQVNVYVLGEVRRPRAITLQRGMTYLDAIMLAGGTIDDAEITRTYIIRSKGERSVVKQVNLERMIECGDMSNNFLLREDDVIFVSKKGLANWNYFIQQLTPTLRYINLVDTTVNALE